MKVFVGYLAGTLLSTAATIYISYYRNETFYATCVNLVAGKVNQMILVNFFLSVLLFYATIIQWITLGKLREAESEQLMNRLWSSIFDALLLATIFSSELTASFFALLAVQILSRCFHWVVKSRVDFMEVQPNVSVLAYIRLFALMIFLLLTDLFYIFYTIALSYVHGPSVQILFGFEYTIQLWNILLVFCKFFLNAYERLMITQWSHRVMFVRIVEFIEQTLKLISLLIFFGTVQVYYGTPIHLFRRIFISFRAFQKGLAGIQDYYRVVRNMNTLFPDATPEEIQENPMCLICRQDMENNSKKLPCGHIFHFNCLYGWLSNSHVCPTCRYSLRDNQPQQRQQAPPPQVQVQAPGQEPVQERAIPAREVAVDQNLSQRVINNPITQNREIPDLQPLPISQREFSQQNEGTASDLQRVEENISLLREQISCITQILDETSRIVNQLQQPKPQEQEETKKEEIEVKKEEEEEESIPEAPLSPREALRQRRLLRFSNPDVGTLE